MKTEVERKKPYYECHITFDARETPRAKLCVEQLGWKFSKIDSDPVVGAGVRCYATHHYNESMSIEAVRYQLRATADRLVECGFNVTRRKIEVVLEDAIYKEVPNG